MSTSGTALSLATNQKDKQVEVVAPREHQRPGRDARAELEEGDDRPGQGHRTNEDAEEDLDGVDVLHRRGEGARPQEGVEPHEHGCEADEAVEHRDELRHTGHLDLERPLHADRPAHGHGRDDQGETGPRARLHGIRDGGQQCDGHADDAEGVARLRRLVPGQAGEAEDEEQGRDDVRGLDQGGRHFSPSGTS